MTKVVNTFDSTGFTGKKKADQTGRRNFFGSGYVIKLKTLLRFLCALLTDKNPLCRPLCLHHISAQQWYEVKRSAPGKYPGALLKFNLFCI